MALKLENAYAILGRLKQKSESFISLDQTHSWWYTSEQLDTWGWTVPIVNMTQAATMAGIGRTTLYRKAKQGVLSTTKMPDGSPGVDTAELFRVFPVKQSDDTVTVAHVDTHETVVETALLRQRVQHLEELLALERQRNTELSHTLKLIEHKGGDQPRRGFWGRLFGGTK